MSLLKDFGWEDDDTNFFNINEEGDGNPEPEKKTQTKPETKPEEVEDEVEDVEDVEQGEEGSFFGADPNKKTSEEESEEIEVKGGTYKDLYKSFKEAGIFKHTEIEDDEEIDEDLFLEIQEQEMETEIVARIEAWATEELDDDAKSFIKFKAQGGSTAEFFRMYSSFSEIPEGDITNESHQDNVIRYQLTQEGWDKDEIEDRIEYLTDNGKKEKVAKKYDDKLKVEVEQKKELTTKSAEENKRVQKQQEEDFKKTVKSTLEDVEEVSGFKITAEDKTKLFSFLTKKDQKISDTKSITGFQKKLGEVFNTPDKMILLAKLIQSDFDMSTFEKKVATKKTREVKNNIEQRKGLRPSSGSSLGTKALAELI